MRIVLIIIIMIGLWYIVLPAPSSIDDIPGLPGAVQSGEPGDTIQNPNIAAYYSNYRRDYATKFYRNTLQQLHCQTLSFLNPFCFIPPIRLNMPVEYAFTYIRDQQQSTYLEAYVYPFKDVLYVNGYEPYDINGVPFSKVSYPIIIDKSLYDSKVTIRYYPSNIFIRTFIYLLMWVGLYWVYKLLRRRFFNK